VRNHAFANAGEILSLASPLQVKNYGPGSSATLSIRGTGASQSLITWNGISIENPLLGQNDLSILPAFFIDRISIEYGNRCAESGSGAIGGVIDLRSDPPVNKGVELSLLSQVSDFNDWNEGMLAGFSNAKISSRVKYFHHSADNDYTFYNLAKAGHPLDTLSNSHDESHGIMCENVYRLNAFQQINLDNWYQKTDRQIPPSMTEHSSDARQVDEALRLAGGWNCRKDHFMVSANGAFDDETLDYSVHHAEDNSNFKTLTGKADASWNIHPVTLEAGTEIRHTRARESAYGKDIRQDHLSFYQGCLYENKKWKFASSLQVREEFIDSRYDPPILSAGLDKPLPLNLAIKASAARNYRTPSLNELYWIPGGNPLLLPEQGWSEDITLEHVVHGKKISMQSTVTLFHHDIEDQITWLPGDAYWSPENVHTVTKGIEASNTCNLKLDQMTYTLIASYQFTRSEYGKDPFTSVEREGNQQIYIPEHRFVLNFQAAYRNYFLDCHYSFTSLSYTTSDNLNFINPYQLVNLYLSKHIHVNKLLIVVQGSVNNLLNESYQIIEYRPMPLRTYTFGIQLDYKSN